MSEQYKDFAWRTKQQKELILVVSSTSAILLSKLETDILLRKPLISIERPVIMIFEQVVEYAEAIDAVHLALEIVSHFDL